LQEEFVANYIARVELIDAENEEDFEKLDAALEHRGFSAQVRDDKDVAFWLPSGTYVLQNSTMELTAVRDAATAGAEETGFEFALVVANFEDAEWAGLEQA
jgi:hypothetical protein